MDCETATKEVFDKIGMAEPRRSEAEGFDDIEPDVEPSSKAAAATPEEEDILPTLLRRRCGYAGIRVGEASHPGPGRAPCENGASCPWHQLGRCCYFHEEPPPQRRRARCQNGAACPWHRKGRCLFVHDEEPLVEPTEMYIGTPRQSDDTGENRRLRKRVARLEQTVEELRTAMRLLHQELCGGFGSDDFDTEEEDNDSEADSSASTSTAAGLEATPLAKPRRRRRPRRKPPAAGAAAAAAPEAGEEEDLHKQEEERPGLALTSPPARATSQADELDFEDMLRPLPPSSDEEDTPEEAPAPRTPPPPAHDGAEEGTPEPPPPPVAPRGPGQGGKEDICGTCCQERKARLIWCDTCCPTQGRRRGRRK